MEQKTMEVVLKYYREKYNLRQEDICRGICPVTTLSRLEQGNREVDSLLGQTLLGRIGKAQPLSCLSFHIQFCEFFQFIFIVQNDLKILVFVYAYLSYKQIDHFLRQLAFSFKTEHFSF